MAVNKNDIIQEALRLLDESGIENVTLRKLASRLGIKAPTLYWHVKNKAVLVNEIADAILLKEFGGMDDLEQADQWQDWLIHLMSRLRKAMLAYKDGARVVTGAHLSLTMGRFTELALKTLINAGLNLLEARLIVLTASHYVFGFVIEEQTPPPPEGIEQFDLEEFSKRQPHVIAGIQEYYSTGRTAEDLFYEGLCLIIKNENKSASFSS